MCYGKADSSGCKIFAMAAEQLRTRLQPLLLNKEVEIKEEIGRGAYGVVNKVMLDGTSCAGKTLHDLLVQVCITEPFPGMTIKILSLGK